MKFLFLLYFHNFKKTLGITDSISKIFLEFNPEGTPIRKKSLFDGEIASTLLKFQDFPGFQNFPGKEMD